MQTLGGAADETSNNRADERSVFVFLFLDNNFQNMAFLLKSLRNTFSFTSVTARSIHQTNTLNEIQLLTRLRVVDNSAIGKEAMLEGKPPKCIHVYNKKGVGTIGKKTSFTIKANNNCVSLQVIKS